MYHFTLLSFKYHFEFLRAWDNGSHISKPDNQECDCLEEYVYKVVVLSVHKIIASGEEQEHSKSKLRKMNSKPTKTHRFGQVSYLKKERNPT
ncbi:hypothetical protein Hanom_Chr07g00656001 [Helianthus anomalus]